MGASVSVANMREFQAALRRVGAACKKPEAEIVNRALKDVAFRAASFTEKADPETIRQELLDNELALKIVTKRLIAQSGGEMIDRMGNTKLTKGGKARKYAKRVTRKMIGLRAAQLIKRRMKLTGFLRAGWFPAIKAFGGVIKGSGMGRIISPPYRLGSAIKATAQKLWGEIANRVFDRMKGKAAGVSRNQMVAALNQAIAFVAKDRDSYANKKEIEAVLRKHSD